MRLLTIETAEEANCLAKHFESSKMKLYSKVHSVFLLLRVLQFYLLVVGRLGQSSRGKVPVVQLDRNGTVPKLADYSLEERRTQRQKPL